MQHLPKVWSAIVRRLRADVPAVALEAWVSPLVATPGDGGSLRLVCPTAFHLERVRGRFLRDIERLVEAECGSPVPVRLVVGSAANRREEARAGGAAASGGGDAPVAASCGATHAAPVRSPAASSQRALPYTFDSFVVGACNALAREASYALAQNRQPGVSPLYLSAPSGLGKTHLVRAALDEVKRLGPSRALYSSAESFTHEFTASLRAKRTGSFKRRFREECDLLVIEDVQYLRGKTWTQLELFHTISHLLDIGRRVILTGDRLPRDLEGLDPHLRSTMASGLVAEMEPPAAQVRRDILRSKAASGGVRLPPECLDLLVERVCGSVRDLDSALIQVVATASLLKRPIDLALTEAALRKLVPSRSQPRSLSPESVIAVVAAFFGTKPEALAARSRRRDVLIPRQLAMFLCCRYTDASHSRIARALGRDHPAVANAVRVMERRMLERAPLRYRVEALSEKLEALRAPAEAGSAGA